MYTALVLDARLEAGVPSSVLDVLSYMITETQDGAPPALPKHDLFGNTRWSWMFRGSSAYFPIEREPILQRTVYSAPTEVNWILSVGLSIKNYNNEIELFLDWIKPYVEEAIGYWQYEEDESVTPVHFGSWVE